MKLIITIFIFLSFNTFAFGQLIKPEEYIQRIKTSQKDKLDSFKSLAILFTDSLDKSNSYKVDEAFIELLKVQTRIQDNYNEFIWDSDDYKEIESIVYSDQNSHTQKAKDFEKYVNENGFIIQTTEGTIFVEKDPDFLINNFSQFLSAPMNSYLKQYCNELAEPFMEDAGINITFDTFKQRVIFWDKFDKQNPDFLRPYYAKNQFELYLYHLLTGVDNTPAFDWQTERISQSYLRVYNEIIQENPNTKTAIILREYIKKLKLNDNKKTEDIMSFTNKYNPY